MYETLAFDVVGTRDIPKQYAPEDRAQLDRDSETNNLQSRERPVAMA